MDTTYPIELVTETPPLEAAARRVATRLHELVPTQDEVEHERLLRRLAEVVVTVGRIANTRAPTTREVCSEADGVLLDHLEHELLWHTAGGEAPQVIRLLRACSTYRQPDGVDGTTEVDGSEDLRSRMLGPDAFELLVEVAHDFRSPLTSILFLAETLRDGHSGPVTDLQRSQLGLMYSAAFGLASVASDVVDLARREKDLVTDDPEPYSFAEVFRSVERMVLPMVQEKGLELRIGYPEHGQADGHPHALSRVLLNLTTNALKFTDEGTVEIGVRLLTQGRIEYSVKDTGRGIPEDRQEEVFQPFKKRRGQGQGDFFSGSGVGLSIARRLVEAMGSSLEFTTSNEHGTRFFFVLPAPRRR